VSRIVLAGALVVVVAAGCGGTARPQSSASHGIPQSLARAWEGQASAIGTAVSAGESCRAMRLAASLREEVTAARHKLPVRLRSPLLTGVSSLADRISTCTRVQVVTVQTPAPKGPKPKPPHGPPGQGRHHHGKHHGDGNDQ
jgi:hypothetical protein